MKIDFTRLREEIKAKALNVCGFNSLRVTDGSPVKGDALAQWLALNCHGQMQYMAKEPQKRLNPKQLFPAIKSIVLVSIPYEFFNKNDEDKLKIASYALGRDYHKIMRSRLKKLIQMVQASIGPFQYRLFVDTAPILEKSFAARAGLGWIGKNTLLIQKNCGSFFVIGGFCCDLPLPPDKVEQINDCGACEQCIKCCPTGALSKSYHLNASRCIAYLTIEYKGSIPIELRPKMGQYIFGCDECQKACPWNQKRKGYFIKDFRPRSWWLKNDLITLLNWTNDDFLTHTEGSGLRRIGYECFLRNVAVALGNSPPSNKRLAALKEHTNHPSLLVREHVNWAIGSLTVL